MMKPLVLAAALLAMPALALAASGNDQTTSGTGMSTSGSHATHDAGSAGHVGTGGDQTLRSLPPHPSKSGIDAGPGDQHSLNHTTGANKGE